MFGDNRWYEVARRASGLPTRDVRVGDAERDGALTSLGDHFAAGRLTKQEYDERAEAVWSARFESDLARLFADLPEPTPDRADRNGRSGRTARSRAEGRPRPPMWAVPFLALGPLVLIALLVTVVMAGLPWLLLLLLCWFLVARVGFGAAHAMHWRRRNFGAAYGMRWHHRHHR